MQDLINQRCGWCASDKSYIAYHDNEWGKLVSDDTVLFEFLVLESAQAGLSWLTILKKRDAYRRAFLNFDALRVSKMTEKDVERLMHFEGIVKNRLKIQSAICNAKIFLLLQKEFGSFSQYILSFFPNHKPIVHHFLKLNQIPVTSLESDLISRDLKSRGFKFFGSTICYSFLQATGFIDDHLEGCCAKSSFLK